MSLGTVDRDGMPIIVAMVKRTNWSQHKCHLLGNVYKGTLPILVAHCYDKTNQSVSI